MPSCWLWLLSSGLVPTPGVGQTPQPDARTPATPSVDVDKLPVSLSRIRRELGRETTSEERFENFRLLTALTVYGQGPRIDFFTDFEDASFESVPGAVRYGGVTHSEFLAQVQPKNLPYGNSRPPIANLSGNLFSLSNWARDKKREAQKRKEEEARKRRVEAAQQDPDK